jgi:peptidoglycan/LPS O-acetylase OafA/YrhL
MITQTRLLSDVLRRDGNNFDILRLVAALAVIVGHSYAISPQPPHQDPVLRLLHFDYSGSLAVKFFFFLSGLLVANSIRSKPNPFHFLLKRAFRIFPGLLLCLLIAVFVVGPLFTNLSVLDYFSNRATWNYMVQNFFLFEIVWRLPGVFDSSKYGLNGSLWTLPYEVLCYLYLAVLFGIGFLKNKIISNLFFGVVIAASFLFPTYLPAFFSQNPEAHLLPASFALGVLFATNKDIIKVDIYQLILIWLLVLLLRSSMAYQFLFYVAFFYSSVYIASLPFVRQRLRLPFDASYGVYVYGFMIQQCIHHLYPGMGLYANQFIASLLAIGMGIFSWYFIEKRFIALGNTLVKDDFLIGVRQAVNNSRARFFSSGSGSSSFLNNNTFAFLSFVLLALFVHAVVLKFIFPGYYSPLYPQHSDFYIPAAFANSNYSFISLLSWPRPMNMIFAKFAGYFGIHGSIAWVVALVCVNCALGALLLRKIFHLKLNWKFALAFAGYCFLLFSHPYFYIFYAQDIAAQLSYFFLISGAWLFYSTYNKSIILSGVLLFACALFAFLSKETYGLSALAFAFLWFIYYRNISVIRAISPFVMIGLALGISFIINVFIKSAFIDLDASNESPYHISKNPITIFNEWFIYAREGLNVANIFLMGVILYLLAMYKGEKKKEWMYVMIGCVLALAASWLPNAVLPNHHFKGYAFNGAYFFYLPLLFVPSLLSSTKVHRLALSVLLITFLASPLLNAKKYKENEWVLIQEDTQRNLLGSLKPLIAAVRPSNTPRKILVEGITFPFHPFVFPQALRVFPNAKYINFDVVNYNPAYANNQQNDLVKFISQSDTALAEYEQKWVFDKDGRLVTVENILANKIFASDSTSGMIVNQENFSSFITTGFYGPENGIRWTDGNSSIRLNNSIGNKDSVIIELNTYMPPVCAKIHPEVTLSDSKGHHFKSALTTRKENMFYYLFVLAPNSSFEQINISAERIDASPDQRMLSFPFIGLEIK